MTRGGPVRSAWTLCTAVVAGTAFALYAGAAPAWAHNALTSSAPVSGATESIAPAAVVLTFDQPVIALGTRVVVTGPDGPVQTGQPRLVDNTVTQPLEAAAPAGNYTVTWRVTSVDGHPVSGTFGYTAAQPGTSSQPAPDELPTPPADLRSRGLGFLVAALLVILAAVPMAVVLLRRRRRRMSGPSA